MANKSKLRGNAHHRWKGGRFVDARGYVKLYLRDHPRAHCSGHVFEHIIVVEKALGKPIPKGAVVHHVNHNRADNRTANLVLCQDSAYHNLLHRRERALVGGGSLDKLNCRFCKQWDDPENMYVPSYVNRPYHRKCEAEYRRNKRKERKFNAKFGA